MITDVSNGPSAFAEKVSAAWNLHHACCVFLTSKRLKGHRMTADIFLAGLAVLTVAAVAIVTMTSGIGGDRTFGTHHSNKTDDTYHHPDR